MSLLWFALERHCLASRAEWRGWVGGVVVVVEDVFKLGAQNSPSWIRCSLSCCLRYVTPTENGHPPLTPSLSILDTHIQEREAVSSGVH